MGIVISLLSTRLEACVRERWRQLVAQVGAERGLSVTDVDGYGRQLWYDEWCPVMDDDAYAEEIQRRLEALQVLLHSQVTATLREQAFAVVTAPMPPELFREHVLEQQSRSEQGWSIQLGTPQSPPPDDVPQIPVCYAHLLWAPEREEGADESK